MPAKSVSTDYIPTSYRASIYRSVMHASHPALKLLRILVVSRNLVSAKMIHLINAQFLNLITISKVLERLFLSRMLPHVTSSPKL